MHGTLACGLAHLRELAPVMPAVPELRLLRYEHDTFLSIRDNAVDLVEQLSKIAAGPNTRIVLVGHSRGGLVARKAAALLVKDGGPRVAVATFGAPHRGTPVVRAANESCLVWLPQPAPAWDMLAARHWPSPECDTSSAESRNSQPAWTTWLSNHDSYLASTMDSNRISSARTAPTTNGDRTLQAEGSGSWTSSVAISSTTTIVADSRTIYLFRSNPQRHPAAAERWPKPADTSSTWLSPN